MYKLFCALLMLFVLANTLNLTWTGQHDIYWNNTENWTPSIIPTKNDNVIIPYNTTNWPYSQNVVYMNNIYNYAMANFYKTNVYINKIWNNGNINFYGCNVYIRDPTMFGGMINCVECYIESPLIILENKSLLHIGGSINGTVYNFMGTLTLSQNINTYITEYVQKNNAKLSYTINKNLLLSDYVSICGDIIVYVLGLYEYSENLIIKSSNIININATIKSQNYKTLANLNINYTTGEIYLISKRK